MNKYHPNINLTVEVNSKSKFLETKIYRDNNEMKCFVIYKEMKSPFHWTSAVPKHYKKRILLLESYIALRTLVQTLNRKLE